jgi:Xaa-Pro aminopeptidase
MLFNKKRAMAYMRQYELDALVATSPVNITYFTDYHCWIDSLFKEYMMVPGASSNLAQAFAVFPLNGAPAFVVNPTFAVNASELWVRDLYVFGEPGLDYELTPAARPEADRRFHDILPTSQRYATPMDALMSILKDRGLTDARIGLEMEGLPSETQATISETLPRASIRDCTSLIRLVRMVKSADEIVRLKRSAEINEQAAMESLALARPGRPISDCIEHYRARMAELGADFDHYAFGVRGYGMATELDYVLTDDDLLYVDFGCIYRHYFSDSGTTLAMREPSMTLLKRHAALRACVAAGVEVMRVGVRASAVSAAMWDALSDHGICTSFPHGHGLGLEVRDYPIIVADNELRIRDDCVDVPSDLTIEVDMVINFEAAIFMPSVGSLHIEQTFIVTPEGSLPLVPHERSRPVLPSVAQ